MLDQTWFLSSKYAFSFICMKSQEKKQKKKTTEVCAFFKKPIVPLNL